MADAIQSVVGGTRGGYSNSYITAPDGRVWKAVRDASVRNGCEFVSPILTYSDIETVQEIVRAVRRVGGRADASAGMHVHVDAKALGFHRGAQKVDAVRRLVAVVNKFEDLIYPMAKSTDRLPSHLGGRARGDGWCAPIKPEFLAKLKRGMGEADLNRAWYNTDYYDARRGHYHHSRYKGLNLHALWDKGTVEFRYFTSSTHAGVVRSYLMLVLALAAWAIDAERCSSKKRPHGQNPKYAARTMLTKLRLNGPEFKNVRMHLMKHLEGDASYMGGRPAPTNPAPLSSTEVEQAAQQNQGEWQCSVLSMAAS